MAKAFSLLSWNVEHFGAKDKKTNKPIKPVEPIINELAAADADVVGIYEVEAKFIFFQLVNAMPNYQFHITEGPQSQEILVGVKKKFSAFFTQRLEFKSGATLLRPGALLTLTIDGVQYPILFLHLKSLSVPKGFGLRDDMTQKVFNLKKALDKAHDKQGLPGKSNFVFLGDLNTMGMNLTYSDKDVSGGEEIDRLTKRASIGSIAMKRLSKTRDVTFWPGSGSKFQPSNLDHVFAANHLEFTSFGGKAVKVSGWVDQPTDKEKDDWAEEFSDHAILFFEVKKV